MDPVNAREVGLDHIVYVRVGVHWVDDLHIAASPEYGERLTNALHARAEALAPVGRDQYELLARIEHRKTARLETPRGQRVPDLEHRVDAGIAGHEDSRRINAL